MTLISGMSQISRLALRPAINKLNSAVKLSRVVGQPTLVPAGMAVAMSLAMIDGVLVALQNVVNVGGEVIDAEPSVVAH